MYSHDIKTSTKQDGSSSLSDNTSVPTELVRTVEHHLDSTGVLDFIDTLRGREVRKTQDVHRKSLHRIRSVVDDPFDSYEDRRERGPQKDSLSNWDPVSEEIFANIRAKSPLWGPIRT